MRCVVSGKTDNLERAALAAAAGAEDAPGAGRKIDSGCPKKG